jgi:hypothetical protein
MRLEETHMIKFKSQATGDLVMVQAHATAVLRLLGKSAEGQGILVPEDMPAALATLKALPDQDDRSVAQAVALNKSGEADDGQPTVEPTFQEEAVSLRHRAWPLAQMIERALAEGKPIVWGV